MRHLVLTVTVFTCGCTSTFSGFQTTGLPTIVITPSIASYFDARIAPGLLGFCTDSEISILRNAMVEASQAIETIDISGAYRAGLSASGISSQCQRQLDVVSAELCAENVIASTTADMPPELGQARIEECYRPLRS